MLLNLAQGEALYGQTLAARQTLVQAMKLSDPLRHDLQSYVSIRLEAEYCALIATKSPAELWVIERCQERLRKISSLLGYESGYARQDLSILRTDIPVRRYLTGSHSLAGAESRRHPPAKFLCTEHPAVCKNDQPY